jgi:hypothetical protein
MITSYVLLGDMRAIEWPGIEANCPATDAKIAPAGQSRLTVGVAKPVVNSFLPYLDRQVKGDALPPSK